MVLLILMKIFLEKENQLIMLQKNTKVDYIPLEQIKPSLIKEINEFMKSLFPKPDLCEYMWDMLASCLIGNNYNQTFHIFTGSGSNGKSLLMSLMRNVLGEYYG